MEEMCASKKFLVDSLCFSSINLTLTSGFYLVCNVTSQGIVIVN